MNRRRAASYVGIGIDARSAAIRGHHRLKRGLQSHARLRIGWKQDRGQTAGRDEQTVGRHEYPWDCESRARERKADGAGSRTADPARQEHDVADRDDTDEIV